MKKLKLSQEPRLKLEDMAYEGQPRANYQYEHGYENLVEMLPDPTAFVDNVDKTVGLQLIKSVMDEIAIKGKKSLGEFTQTVPKGAFERRIIGVEESEGEGQEVLFALWGEGFKSPVHGHGKGLLYENLVQGKFLINEYSITNKKDRTVKPYRSFIQKPGVMLTMMSPVHNNDRSFYVHNFTALEPSLSLHYVPEHTRDGRDNAYQVQYFIPNEYNVEQISTYEAMYLPVGEVLLVRSHNVPFYGDHYIIVVGGLEVKEHGTRPMEHVVQAGSGGTASRILDAYSPMHGATLLKLNTEEKRRFFDWHSIKLDKIIK